MLCVGLLLDWHQLRVSDSAESVAREIGIFFPGFSIDRWFLEEEEYFKNGAVSLCAEEFIHCISPVS
jgi:hypothetical protein